MAKRYLDQRRLKEKRIRRLYRELLELCKKRERAPKVKLDEPFQRGFERFFVPTEKALLRSDIEQFEEALKYFQNHQICRKGCFGAGGGKTGKRKAKDPATHHPRRPHLKQLLKDGISRISLSYASSKRYDLTHRLQRLRKLSHFDYGHRLSFRYPELIRSQVQPFFVTHLPLHDQELEARIDELDQILFGGNNTALAHRTLYWKKWRHDERSISERAHLEDFRQQLDEANQDPTIQSAISPRFFCALLSVTLRCGAIRISNYSTAILARTMRISP